MFETTKPQGPDKVQGQEPIVEMNLGIVSRIHSTLVGIVTHLKANRITDSEKRELEFDKDRRFEQLLEALKKMSSRSSDGDSVKPKKSGGLMDLMKWVGKVFGLAFTGFKMFFGKFLKFLMIGTGMTFLRVAGLILSRLFWPLTIGAAMLWAIPKVIDAWPGIKQMIQNTVSGIWTSIMSFLGIEDDDDDAVAAMEERQSAPDVPTHYWDKNNNQWVIGTQAIAGVPRGREEVIKKLVPWVTGDKFDPEYLPVVINQLMGQSVATIPTTPITGDSLLSPGETPIIGDSVFMSIPGTVEADEKSDLDLGLVRMIAGPDGGVVPDAVIPTETVLGDELGEEKGGVLVGDIQAAQSRASSQMDDPEADKNIHDKRVEKLIEQYVTNPPKNRRRKKALKRSILHYLGQGFGVDSPFLKEMAKDDFLVATESRRGKLWRQAIKTGLLVADEEGKTTAAFGWMGAKDKFGMPDMRPGNESIEIGGKKYSAADLGLTDKFDTIKDDLFIPYFTNDPASQALERFLVGGTTADAVPMDGIMGPAMGGTMGPATAGTMGPVMGGTMPPVTAGTMAMGNMKSSAMGGMMSPATANTTNMPRIGSSVMGAMGGMMSPAKSNTMASSNVKMSSPGSNQAALAFPSTSNAVASNFLTTPPSTSSAVMPSDSFLTTPNISNAVTPSDSFLTTPAVASNDIFMTTPATTVPGEDPPEVIVVPNETHSTHTVPVVSTSSSKKIVNQQAFYSDPFYGHLGL